MFWWVPNWFAFLQNLFEERRAKNQFSETPVSSLQHSVHTHETQDGFTFCPRVSDKDLNKRN